MTQTPRLAAHLHIEIIKDRGAMLVSQAGYVFLKGRMFEFVAPLIDGNRSTDEIADILRGRLSAAETYYAITLLEQKGYVRDSDNATSARGY